MEKQEHLNKQDAAFWTAKACAAYINCSVGAIWHWKRTGQLPFYSYGRIVRFKREDLDQLMSRKAAQ